jgi:hypothetical protein
MFRWLLIGVAVLAVMAAQHGATGAEPYNSPIVGNWNWVRSCSVIPVDCEYPDSNHPNQTLWFHGDSSYAWYVGGEQHAKGRYHFEVREVAPDSTAEVVVFDGGSPSVFGYCIIDFVNSNTLILRDPYWYGFTYVYQRILWEF